MKTTKSAAASWSSWLRQLLISWAFRNQFSKVWIDSVYLPPTSSVKSVTSCTTCERSWVCSANPSRPLCSWIFWSQTPSACPFSLRCHSFSSFTIARYICATVSYFFHSCASESACHSACCCSEDEWNRCNCRTSVCSAATSGQDEGINEVSNSVGAVLVAAAVLLTVVFFVGEDCCWFVVNEAFDRGVVGVDVDGVSTLFAGAAEVTI